MYLTCARPLVTALYLYIERNSFFEVFPQRLCNVMKQRVRLLLREREGERGENREYEREKERKWDY
jgi:hypothetical protein